MDSHSDYRKVTTKRLKSIVNKSYKDMGGKGAAPNVRLGDLPSFAGGLYNPFSHSIHFKPSDGGTAHKKVVDINKYMNSRIQGKSFKEAKKIIKRGFTGTSSGGALKYGTTKTRLHHIYHETAHAVDSSKGLGKVFTAHRFLAPLVGVPLGIKKASDKKDKHAVAKGAAIGGLSTSGTLAQEISPEIRIYKMLRKKGIKRGKAANFIGKSAAENLIFRSVKPLLVAGGIAAIGKHYQNKK